LWRATAAPTKFGALARFTTRHWTVVELSRQTSPKNTYRCFRCGSAGNRLDLWAAATKRELHQAAIDLCEKVRISVPWIKQDPRGS
jgi:hypothetical protein